MHGDAPQLTEVDYICVAADLLTKMLSELQSLELDSLRLNLSMAAAGRDLRQPLHELRAIVERLTSSPDCVGRAALRQRAKSLIFRLATELEELAVDAELNH